MDDYSEWKRTPEGRRAGFVAACQAAAEHPDNPAVVAELRLWVARWPVDVELPGRRVWHKWARQHHRAECQCPNCSTNGREACSEQNRCGDCREPVAAPPAGGG